ncbi:hypothetical protein [Rhodococcus erythropolis]
MDRDVQERYVFLLLGDLLAQSCQLSTFRGGQRLIFGGPGSIKASSFVGDPPPERVRAQPEVAGGLGDGASGIDRPAGGLDLVLGRKRPARAVPEDILPRSSRPLANRVGTWGGDTRPRPAKFTTGRP